MLCKSVCIKSFLHLAVGSDGEAVLHSALVLLLGGLGMKWGVFQDAWTIRSRDLLAFVVLSLLMIFSISSHEFILASSWCLLTYEKTTNVPGLEKFNLQKGVEESLMFDLADL